MEVFFSPCAHRIGGVLGVHLPLKRLYSKVLTERTASRNVIVLFYFGPWIDWREGGKAFCSFMCE